MVNSAKNLCNFLNETFAHWMMDVFATIDAELSTSTCAVLSRNTYRPDNGDNLCSSADCNVFDGNTCESARVATDTGVKFLQTKLQDLNVSVVVLAQRPADSSLKLRGSWSEICLVRTWLIQLVQNVESQLSVQSTESVEIDTSCVKSIPKQSVELSPNKPRRSLRKSLMARKYTTVAETLLEKSPGLEQRIAKPAKQHVVQKKLLQKSSNHQWVNGENSEETSAPYQSRSAADCVLMNASDCEASSLNVTLSNRPTTMYDSLLREHCSEANMGEFEVKTADGTSPASSGLDNEAMEESVTSRSSVLELKCDSCEYVTTNQRCLLLHAARSHGQRSYVCQICQHTFAVAKDLNKHMKFHTERYCCEQCGRTLKSNYALRHHIARIHQGAASRPVKRYLCTLCGKMCRSHTDYNIHKNKVHTGIRPFHCNICTAEFFAKENLRAHQLVHSNERVFKCLQCDKSFKQRQGLRIHLAVHASQRPFTCEKCGKMFTQRSALVRHARTHTSERPFRCYVCSATFNDNSILRRHLLGIHKDVIGASHHPVVSPAVSYNVTETRAVSTSSAAFCIDVLTTPKPDTTELNASTSQLLAVLTSTSLPQRHVGIVTDIHTPSSSESLQHYLLMDAWKSLDSRQPNM